MKLFLTALLALSTISVSLADTPITEGHSYKVVNGNLVDTTASSEFAGSAPTPTPIPAQLPTIIINDNVTTQTQQVEVSPPAPAQFRPIASFLLVRRKRQSHGYAEHVTAFGMFWRWMGTSPDGDDPPLPAARPHSHMGADGPPLEKAMLLHLQSFL
jgi:hypothetical protein